MTRFRSVCAQGHLTKKEQHLRHYKIEKSKKVGKNFLMMKSRVEDHLNGLICSRLIECCHPLASTCSIQYEEVIYIMALKNANI